MAWYFALQSPGGLRYDVLHALATHWRAVRACTQSQPECARTRAPFGQVESRKRYEFLEMMVTAVDAHLR